MYRSLAGCVRFGIYLGRVSLKLIHSPRHGRPRALRPGDPGHPPPVRVASGGYPAQDGVVRYDWNRPRFQAFPARLEHVPDMWIPVFR